MYVHAEAYIDETALNDWLRDNGYFEWDGEDLEVLTDYISEADIQFDVVKIL